MLKHRLIATLIVRQGQVVQSVQFKHTNVIHWKAETAVDFFDQWAVDEIVVLDVTRDQTKRDVFLDTVERISRKTFVPITVGGWLSNTEDIKRILRLGADKVAINTQAVKNPGFIRDAVKMFGSQCIVLSMDVKTNESGHRRVVVDRGRELTQLDPVEWARQAAQLGVGEVFFNSVEHDGNREGYDLKLISAICKNVTVPVVAMGGASTWDHLVQGIRLGGAQAVAAANVFHYTEHSAKKAKKYMREKGINVR